jgi:hypothetical protein
MFWIHLDDHFDAIVTVRSMPFYSSYVQMRKSHRFCKYPNPHLIHQPLQFPARIALAISNCSIRHVLLLPHFR